MTHQDPADVISGLHCDHRNSVVDINEEGCSLIMIQILRKATKHKTLLILLQERLTLNSM